MEKKDILHLARLARIRINETEAEALLEDIGSVLEYVSVVEGITTDSDLTKKTGVRFNIFREDVVTNAAEEYTQALLAEAPSVQGRHLTVKKILQMD